MRRPVAVRLAVLLLSLAAVPAPAWAAFEIRADGAHASGHLPRTLLGRIPGEGPLDHREESSGPDGSTRWCARLVHACPFGLDGLAYDAIALESARDGSSAMFACARLRAGDYAEWEVAAAFCGPGGLGVAASLLRTQPGEALAEVAGISPRSAWTISPGWRSPAGRLQLEFWMADAMRGGDHRRLGLGAELTSAVSFELRRGVTLQASRTWRGDRARNEAACGLVWSIGRIASIGRTWDLRGGEATWVEVSGGACEGSAWMAGVGEGMPPSPGFSLAWRPGARRARGRGPARASAGRRQAAPMDGLPAGSGEVSGADAQVDWESLISAGAETTGEEWDGGLLLDDLAMTATGEPDSLAGSADSLETSLQPQTRLQGDRPHGGQPGPGGVPFPVARVRGEDLRGAAGLDSSSAERLASFLRSVEAASLGALDPPAGLRRDLVRAAPVLRVGRAAAAQASGPGGTAGARVRVDGRRSLRLRSGQAATATDRAGLAGWLAGWSWQVDGVRAGEELAREARGSVLLTAPGRVAIAAGRGGRPVRWGLGLLSRAQPVRLTARAGEPAGSGRARARQILSDLVSPSRAGSDRYAAVAVASADERWYGLAAARDSIFWIGAARETAGRRVGLLAGAGRGGPWVSLEARRGSPSEAALIELASAPREPMRAAVRWCGSRRPVRGGRAWWDMGGQGSVASLAPPPLGAAAAGASSQAQRASEQRAWIRGGWTARGARATVEAGGLGRTDPFTGSGDRRRQSRMVLAAGEGLTRMEARVDRYDRRWTTGKAGVSPFDPPTASTTRQWRWRTNVQRALAGVSRAGRMGWGAEAGGLRVSRRLASGPRPVRADWFGLWGSVRGTTLDFSCGLLQTGTAGTNLAITPSWAPGVRADLPGRGTWIAGRLRARAGPLELRAGWIFPYADSGGERGARAARVVLELAGSAAGSSGAPRSPGRGAERSGGGATTGERGRTAERTDGVSSSLEDETPPGIDAGYPGL